MSLPKFEDDLNIISKLDDEPNDVGGLSSTELKAKFDEAALIIQNYINNVLLAGLDNGGAENISVSEIPGVPDIYTVQEALVALKEQINNAALGNIPDRSIVAVKIALEAVGSDELADNAVNSEKLADKAVTSEKLADKAVTSEKLAKEAVTSELIKKKTITASNVKDNSLTGNQLEDLTVTALKLALNAVTNSKIADSAISRAKLGSDVKILGFSDVIIPVSAWEADTTFEDFPYKAAIECSGVTENFTVDVVFSPADVSRGIFCTVTIAYENGVYIYASEIPEEDITIPTIYCIPLA
jgi:hypothetical protein